jgi:hypothetical protein
MNEDVFEHLYGRDINLTLKEEATHRTNEAARQGLIVGTGAWIQYRDWTLSDLYMDYHHTHPGVES